MKCHYTNVEGVGRVHIPGCMGAAVHGPSRCTCRWKPDNPITTRDKERVKLIKELEKENARLERIINKLTGRK
jgi:hypothetical protein